MARLNVRYRTWASSVISISYGDKRTRAHLEVLYHGIDHAAEYVL